MAFIKYSIGGAITSAVDSESNSNFDDSNAVTASQLTICDKCGLQFALSAKNKEIKCECGGTVKVVNN